MQSLIEKSFRQILLHYVPELEEYSTVMPEFFKNCYAKKFPTDWRLHLAFLHYLNFSNKISQSLTLDCLRSCVIRWSLMGMEHIAAKAILLGSPFLENKCVGLCKSESVEKPGKYLIIKTNKKFSDHVAGIAYQANWQNLVWEKIL